MKFYDIEEKIYPGIHHSIQVKFDIEDPGFRPKSINEISFKYSFSKMAIPQFKDLKSIYYPKGYLECFTERGLPFITIIGNNMECMEKIANTLKSFNEMAPDIYDAEIKNVKIVSASNFIKILEKHFSYVILDEGLNKNSPNISKRAKI